MLSSLTAAWTRVFGVLGRVSMYRLVFLALLSLTVIAFALSLFDLVAPGPLELAVTAAVLAVVCVAVDVAAHRILHLNMHIESSIITASILLFVLRPSLDPLALVGIAIGAAVASLSKYVLAWRGRHIFNPAAVGATALTLLGAVFPALGGSSWWVGTPAMAGPVIVLGLAVLWRTEKVRVIAVFLVVAIGVGVLRTSAQYQAAGVEIGLTDILWPLLWSGPFLFLGAFMLSEPLTLPPRRWQQLTVAAVVGVLAGWPIPVGAISLGQERALLIGNLVAFAFALRTAVRLTLAERDELSPTVRRLTFRARRRFAFTPGQYLELDVPHRHPDARGTRREFSIASAPEDLPMVSVAFKESTSKAPLSSYKKALAQVTEGTALAVTGVWGDFLLPTRTGAPVLMVAAGIGVTPFVSQLRHARLAGEDRDIVLVYVASEPEELVYRDEIEASGVPVVVFTRTEPADLPPHWRWARGVRLDADGLLRVVPDIAARHAYISGPPGLIAELAPALERARSITTDAFSGY
ncbi:flavodoxin reductase [Microbacterium thalassium]|uniref:Ferredoxin-NADP reductase/heme/copper-type cytochrome/quinol oxidase subunit 4 n=1 Tax=Microbacterium thalassium TaxID=362649 RepID=A0A7X0KVN7_9MICO|nr:flavodoxin reductase [Microbacterium thalassium]MBB6392432.1 ferredoxin-NADP reductase/heme/copper-type cytochrome/quinol oxidase subunit 4 [Microbacterium thalassium]